jgi:hypothetical protein
MALVDVMVKPRQHAAHGKPQQARELLAPVYGWFTEGAKIVGAPKGALRAPEFYRRSGNSSSPCFASTPCGVCRGRGRRNWLKCRWNSLPQRLSRIMCNLRPVPLCQITRPRSLSETGLNLRPLLLCQTRPQLLSETGRNPPPLPLSQMTSETELARPSS